MELPGGMKHPIVLHLYVHLMELSNDPLAAMSAADVLRTRFPHAGHLTHMASHIDIWGGRYKVETARTEFEPLDTATVNGQAEKGCVLQTYHSFRSRGVLCLAKYFDAANKAEATHSSSVTWCSRSYPGLLVGNRSAGTPRYRPFSPMPGCVPPPTPCHHEQATTRTDPRTVPFRWNGGISFCVFVPGGVGRQHCRDRRGQGYQAAHQVRLNLIVSCAPSNTWRCGEPIHTAQCLCQDGRDGRCFRIFLSVLLKGRTVRRRRPCSVDVDSSSPHCFSILHDPASPAILWHRSGGGDSDDSSSYIGYRVHNVHMAAWAVSGGVQQYGTFFALR